LNHAQRLAKLPSDEFCQELNFALTAPPNLLSPQYNAACVLFFSLEQPSGLNSPVDSLRFRPSLFRQPLPDSLAKLLPVLLPRSSDTGASNSLSPSMLPPTVVEVSRSPQAFPLKLMQADRYIAPRVALIGFFSICFVCILFFSRFSHILLPSSDAGHVTHPLAGQGLNMGISDVSALISTLESAVVTGRDIGSSQVLAQYDSQQKLSNSVMLGAMHSIFHIFQYALYVYYS
jgi:2-polyprenyl-6-methoxyphenol hydroxylase-like FAD-dependent oxidoreductase